MAFLTCKLKSAALQTTTAVRLYFPCDLPPEEGNEVKGVFTLLHGFTNDGQDWVNSSSALRYARENGLALVIPDASNSFYSNLVGGQAWNTWLNEEMPELLDKIVRLPHEREKNFLCGLSMGGYGAMYIGMTHPERYAGVASFSGCLDMALMASVKDNPLVHFALDPVLGRELEVPPEQNLFHLAEKLSALPREQQPKLLCTVGKQDHAPYYIYEQNQRFDSYVRQLPLDYTYMEWDGAHEWNLWDRSLTIAIDRFFNPGYAEQKVKEWSCGITERRSVK